jgi:hypothetical protein
VDWTASLISVPTGVLATPAQIACLENVVCKAGSEVRDCGKPLLKLSGFSTFSLIVSFLLIIVIYYF